MLSEHSDFFFYALETHPQPMEKFGFCKGSFCRNHSTVLFYCIYPKSNWISIKVCHIWRNKLAIRSHHHTQVFSWPLQKRIFSVLDYTFLGFPIIQLGPVLHLRLLLIFLKLWDYRKETSKVKEWSIIGTRLRCRTNRLYLKGWCTTSNLAVTILVMR